MKESTGFCPYILFRSYTLKSDALGNCIRRNGFYNSCRICFVSKILATFVQGSYVPAIAVSKFPGPFLCTASARLIHVS